MYILTSKEFKRALIHFKRKLKCKCNLIGFWKRIFYERKKINTSLLLNASIEFILQVNFGIKSISVQNTR
jgi:hypothetical protein